MVARVQQSSRSDVPVNLFGEVSEARVVIEGIGARALIDTTSMVSTVSSDFFKNSLSNTLLQPLTDLFNVQMVKLYLLKLCDHQH